MKRVVIDGLTIIAAVCALGLTAVAARREIAGSQSSPSRPGREPVMIPAWDSVRTVGHRFGSPTAPVTVVEFGDFECPACGRFALTMKAILKAYPNDVQFVYRHWPLSYHRFARPAARAFECGAAQSSAEPLYYLLYQMQDSLGLISFTEIAARAGIKDTASFSACTREARPVAAIEADLAAVARLPLRGTPAIIVNGLYVNAVPDSAGMDGFIRSALRESRR